MMKSTKKCPLFSTISLAADGDEVAIEKILNHYDAYISKASLRPFYDEHGNMYIVVDMELKVQRKRNYPPACPSCRGQSPGTGG